MNAIIIFVKNPELGKVKTRLAATIGPVKALAIYKFLMQHTREVTSQADADKYLFYSNKIEESDEWSSLVFHKLVQHESSDLGTKMYAAFTHLLRHGYKKVLIVGSDCLELSPGIISTAWEHLEGDSAVIGPAEDGGYYAIGFRFQGENACDLQTLEKVFLGKQWSHHAVFDEACDTLKKEQKSFALLPTLNDVDEEEDVKSILHLF
ncbi:MAG: TIGR04282 family arsenosugar biosynthesis glycosyltransferase [Spirosomataceae bacterium]